MTSVARVFLELTIGKRVTLYRLVPLDPDPRVATRAWRLFRPSGKSYDVAICDRGWITCTCPDASYRQHDCKHIRAIRAHGLLPRERHEEPVCDRYGEIPSDGGDDRPGS